MRRGGHRIRRRLVPHLPRRPSTELREDDPAESLRGTPSTDRRSPRSCSSPGPWPIARGTGKTKGRWRNPINREEVLADVKVLRRQQLGTSLLVDYVSKQTLASAFSANDLVQAAGAVERASCCTGRRASHPTPRFVSPENRPMLRTKRRVARRFISTYG